MIIRFLQGFDLNDETLALDVIGNVGPGGTFLKEKSTLKYLTSELRIPSKTSIFTSKDWDKWKAEGGKTVLEKAKERYEKILSEYSVEPLPKDIERQLKEILYMTEKQLVK